MIVLLVSKMFEVECCGWDLKQEYEALEIHYAMDIASNLSAGNHKH
ncbi:hypothetical protein VCRA219O19_70150 [Vibrio crassostreae]|nr:hypothetical protein VCRA219O19_70150 [Vibrio crassostreae]